ncbi:MAG TPA: SDR family oxidoreductase [Anaerolineae bacterium]|nr:SDR family oxidoreductase [Anaerolineae bacterium]
MDLRLKDKVVLVTAASRGLGAASAHRFAAEGAQVAISARDKSHITQTALDIAKDTAARIFPIVGDVTKPEDADRTVQDVIDRFGRIDILIVNAGGPPAGPFKDMKWDQWEAAAHLVLLSAVRLCQAAIPHMLKNNPPDRGSIVAITSYVARQPGDGLAISNSLKISVVGLMKSLANEYAAQGIRVNSIAPGWTMTDRIKDIFRNRSERSGTSFDQEAAKVIAQIPIGRIANPDEFADALVWLASPCASYVTGILLPVDGGLTQSYL